MSFRPNEGMQIVTSPSRTHSDAGGSTASGIGANDQSSFCLAGPWLHIRDLVWTTLLIGTGMSAFTTGDMWVTSLGQPNYLPAEIRRCHRQLTTRQLSNGIEYIAMALMSVRAD